MQVSFHEYTIHILRRTLYFNCCKLFLTKTSVSHIKVQECIFSLSDVNIWRSVTVSQCQRDYHLSRPGKTETKKLQTSLSSKEKFSVQCKLPRVHPATG